MTTMVSPGVYDRIVDRSFIVNAGGILAGGIVITSDRGPTELTTVTSTSQFKDRYGLPTRDNPSMFSAFRYLRRANILSVVRVINDAVAATGFAGEEADPMFEFTAENPGAWGNDITIEFEDRSEREGDGKFDLIVYEDGEEMERFLVSRDTEAKDGFGTNLFIEDRVNENSMLIRVTDNPDVEGDPDFTDTVTLSGGSNDTAPVDSGDIVSAWDLFDNIDDVPANLLINAGFAVPEVQVKMLGIAQSRGDAVALLDVPQDTANDVQQMIDYATEDLTQNTYFGGLYGGWVKIYDQYNDREVNIPPSADVAAIFNFTASVAERWNAPAGVQRGVIPNAMGVSKVFTQGERDMLYDNNINPVTTYAGASAIVWGQKTLQQQASALDRFNVVNLILWANQRMKEALQPFVFENNTSETRDAVNFLLSSFWENIQQRGGVYNFYVDTSEEINTPFVIDNNQMLVDVYIQPVRTAEFIRLSTIVTPTGVELG